MKYKLLEFKFLILIVILGAFLRLYNLDKSPASLNWDEAAWGYNAYSVSVTLHDEYNKFLPIFTRSFDEYKSTLPMYLMIPTIKLFGLNAIGVRLPSAIIGVLSIVLIYLLSKEIFKNEIAANFSAFVFAITPWAVHLSRVYYDANEAMFFLMLGVLLFFKSKMVNKLLPLSVLSFMLSMYTYNSNKIISPLILGFLVFTNWEKLKVYKEIHKKISIAILAICLSVFVYLIFQGQAFARVSTTNIFVLWKDESFPKIFYFTWELVGRYIGYFSPYNLFLREPLEPSTVVAGNSLFHPFEFIPWVIGLFYLFKNYKKHWEVFIILLLTPLPAILTWNFFQPGRVMALLFLFSVLIGVGLSKLPKIVYPFVVVLGLLNAFYLFDSINVYLPFRDGGNYQPGFRETVPGVMKSLDQVDQVIIDTPQAQPYIFYLFYGAYDPVKYHKELDLNYIGTPRKHFDFGKFYFRDIDLVEDIKLKNTLLVVDEKIIKTN
jgi:4-amino-4-deoxy-L-arabinose transferase-like glycosyltransferase